jgi:hypothetical protein
MLQSVIVPNPRVNSFQHNSKWIELNENQEESAVELKGTEKWMKLLNKIAELKNTTDPNFTSNTIIHERET